MPTEQTPEPDAQRESSAHAPSPTVDPNVVGGVGLAMGGVVGLGLGLKAEHDAQAAGQPVSWVTKAAIIRGALGLAVGAVALFVVLILFVGGHQAPNNPLNINTCKAIPRPGPAWTCEGGDWVKFAP